MTGGECKIIPRAEYAVVGKTQYDQDYVDTVVEAGVNSCGFDRPKPRPPSFDEPSRGSAVQTAPAPPRKPSLWQRIKTKVQRKPVAGVVTPRARPLDAPAIIVQPAPEPPPVITAPPADPPPAKPARLPVDELLDPDGSRS